MLEKILKKIRQDIHKNISKYINVEDCRGSVRLSGELENWQDIVKAGMLARNKAHLGVLNDIKLKGHVPKLRKPNLKDKLLEGKSPDVLIIGAGVVGSAIARELSRYDLQIFLIDKENDVAIAASSRNDGDIHVGIDLKKNQQKHYYNSRGNAMFDKLSSELDFDFQRTGHAMIFSKSWERLLVPFIKLRAKQLGIKGTIYLSPEKMKKIEPSIPSWCKGAFYMPSGGEVSPYKLTVALAENAVANGVELYLNTMVESMKVDNDKITEVITNRGVIFPKLVINAAGVFSDIIADMAKDRTFTIHPRKGTNLILDKKVKHFASISMSKAPFAKEKKEITDKSKNTKGGGVAHTVDDNVLIGPNAIETPDREDFSTDQKSINEIFAKHKKVAEAMTKADVITYFSGIRAATYEEDFVVRKGIFTKNILHAAGIQSPGLTAAPAIAIDICKWSIEALGDVRDNINFSPIRLGVPELKKLLPEERDRLIKQNPDYGVIICRCEEISKGEIIDALSSPIVVPTVDAIKRRVRPGMGRCQGGFCSPLVMGIIAEKMGIPLENVKKSSLDSDILYGDTKGG